MLEELLEFGLHGDDVSVQLENAILITVCLFYFFSFLELLHLPFRLQEDKPNNGNKTDEEEKEKNRKKGWRRARLADIIFQIAFNLSTNRRREHDDSMTRHVAE